MGHRSADDLVVGLTGARFGGAAGRRSRAAAQSPAEEDADAAHRRRGEQPAVGQAGTRFSAVLRRWRQKKQEDAESKDSGLSQGHAVPQPEPTPVAEPSSADPAESDRAGHVGSAGGIDRAGGIHWADWDAVKEPEGLVRPYSWTAGRTVSRLKLSLETLVSVNGQPLDPMAPPEHRTIVQLCNAPRSVAELAALLSIPLGVVRVVLGDMVEAGNIVVHRTAGSSDAAPGIDLMQRVLNGLRRL
jgi:Protein of unknown function (DUF742)